MLIFKRHPVSLMVLFAVALHLFWAVAIMVDSSALNSNAVNAIARFIGGPWMIVCLFVVAFMALSCVMLRLPWWMLLPQQALLMMSAAGSIESIWLSQFADGVTRPAAFIAADQIYAVLAAIGHTAAVLNYSAADYSNRID